jgi:tetratricopeptide (TPR) repeat protein
MNSGIRYRLFIPFLLLIVGGTILRSALATRFDDFTFDEAYHITAGVSYVQRGDFRINPEHPPLVKLWVGSFLSATGFNLNPLRVFQDKFDERAFTSHEVFLHNDADSVQRRSRVAMWILNGASLVALGLALRRAFCAIVALSTILFLAIDPTVAAHLPVVMTDLPVALLSATAVVLGTRAFLYWDSADLVLCSAALGLSLGAKHSAPVFYIFLGFIGCILAMVLPRTGPKDLRALRIAKVFGVLAGALLILWGLYFFRFRESSSTSEVFNRPLAEKITDVGSPGYRVVLRTMVATRATPRAYIWGFADTVHAGLEGRAHSLLAFGRLYYFKAPWYFFPGVIAVKLPIGLGVLALVGGILFLSGRLPREWMIPTTVLVAAAVCFLFVLRSGATYAGIRHALPAVPFLAVLGGMASYAALTSPKKTPKVIVALAFLAAGISALPVMRPWEYYNEAVGTSNAYLYFDDEGVDLGLRGKELAEFSHNSLQPAGEIPFISYQMSPAEKNARKIDWLGRDLARDERQMNSRILQGTVIISGRDVSKKIWWDAPALRAETPLARFGNLFVFRGTLDMSGRFSRSLYFAGLAKEYAEKPDLEAAEHLLTESAQADPRAFFVHIELGNIYLKLGLREEALQAYRSALDHTPDDPVMRRSIEDQIRRLSIQALDEIPALRNPALE